MTLKNLINTVLFEQLNMQTMSLALRTAILNSNGLSPAVLAKEIIAKQSGEGNFKNGKPILPLNINQNNFVENILVPANLTQNELAIKVAELVKDELFGLNATKKFGKEKL